MTATKLATIEVEKPWGRDTLPSPFSGERDFRTGEIWFPAPDGRDMPLLVKYLFTSEKLSIQVHPNDDQARERGFPSGKEECWYIVDAKPGATLGIGSIKPLSPTELHASAISGDIEELMEWHPVKAGMLFHIPPGTVHAIGPGISLIEVQQNIDLTYRLYDYGRPRELHLDDGVAVARADPFPPGQMKSVDWSTSHIALETSHFTLAAIVDGDVAPLIHGKGPYSIIPIEGTLSLDGVSLQPGECALADDPARLLASKGSRTFIAWPA